MRPLLTSLFLSSACASQTVVAIPCVSDAAERAASDEEAPLERDAFARGSAMIARGFAVDSAEVIARFAVEREHCVEVSLEVSRGIVDADLEIRTLDGTLVASDDLSDRFARVRVCAPEAATFVAIASAARGAGELAIRVGESSDATLGARAVYDGSSSLDSRVARSLNARGYRLDPPRDPIALRATVPLVIGIGLGAEECVAVVASSEHALRLALRDASVRVLVEDRSAETDTRELRVERCTDADGRPTTITLQSERDARVELVVARAHASRIGGNAGVGGFR